MRVSHACLTSTVAGLLDAADVQTLETLTLGGEPASKHSISKWAGKVKLNNIYGPAECTVWCFVQRHVQVDDNECRFGFGMETKGWIVDPDNADKLSPVGAIGELLIEGPLLSRGYLNSPDKTAQSFIYDPPWMSMFGLSTRRRLYKTGDLVRYDVTDGAMIFVARKDTQVKLRGQRIELGEIEHHLRLGLAEANVEHGVVVDMLKPSTSSDAVLAVFIALGDTFLIDSDQPTFPFEVKTYLRALASGLKQSLSQFLPSYMIPAAFIPVHRIPITVSAKTDRRRLRQLATNLPWNEIMAISSSSPLTFSEKEVMMKSAAEMEMAEEWASLLAIPADMVQPNHSFIALGGNSLSAIQLVAAYRVRGLSLTVADVMQYPTLSHMTARITHAQAAPKLVEDEIVSRLNTGGVSNEQLLSQAAEQCRVGINSIVSITPCTPLQEEMMSLSLTGQTTQFAHELMRLWPSLDIPRYQKAWASVVRAHPILRTRFMRSSRDGLLRQVVIDEDVYWQNPKSFDDYMSAHFPVTATTQIGHRLARWSLYEEEANGHEQAKNQMLIISLHHSIFDGVVLHHVLAHVFAAYQGHPLPPGNSPDFRTYLRHIEVARHDKAARRTHADFWRRYMAGWDKAGRFPRVPHADYSVRANAGAQRFLPFRQGVPPNLSNVTLSTLLRGCWAVFLARRTASETILFSTFLAGRSVDMPGIEKLVAPTFTHVPIVAHLSPRQTVREFLSRLQAEAVSMTPYEATGMQRIRETCDSRAEFATLAANLLVVQPMPKSQMMPVIDGEGIDTNEKPLPFPGQVLCGPRIDPAAMGPFNPFPLLMELTMLVEGVGMRVSFDEHVLSPAAVEDALDELTLVIKSLVSHLDDLLSVSLSACLPAQDLSHVTI
ncbi:hypothetical protein GGS20DRAFT_582201 [Poronia punctata]|nr:hypothetical protein GGS20DRAFT_582201 [Poronia punctata]